MHSFKLLTARSAMSPRSSMAQQWSRTHSQPSSLQIFIICSFAVGLGIFTIVALASKHAMLLIPAILFPFVAMIVGRLRELLLALIILDIPFNLDIHLGFREEMAKMGALAGFNVSVTTVCLVVLYLLWLGEFVCKQGPRLCPKIRESLPVIGYIAALALSLVFAADVGMAFSQIALLLQMLLLYIYVVSTVQSRQDLVFLITLLMASLILESTLMMYMRITGQDFTLGPISTKIDGVSHLGTGRLGGTLGSPNAAGSYLAMLTLVASSVFFTRLGRFHKLFAGVAFSCGVAGLVLTGSRGGWVSFAIAVLLLWLLAWRRGWLSLHRFLVIMSLTVLLGASFYETIRTRLVSDDRGAAYSRVPLMNLAFRMINENPVLGVGANNFAFVMNDYITPEIRNAWIYTVHNQYLLIWAESGTVGLSAFLWFLAATLQAGWHSSRARDRLIGPLAFGLAGAVLVVALHMFVDFFNDRPLLQLLVFVAAVITALEGVCDSAAKLCRAPKATASTPFQRSC
jgi:putative inorganic carbon (hco3(-)) transporter